MSQLLIYQLSHSIQQIQLITQQNQPFIVKISMKKKEQQFKSIKSQNDQDCQSDDNEKKQENVEVKTGFYLNLNKISSQDKETQSNSGQSSSRITEKTGNFNPLNSQRSSTSESFLKFSPESNPKRQSYSPNKSDRIQFLEEEEMKDIQSKLRKNQSQNQSICTFADEKRENDSQQKIQQKTKYPPAHRIDMSRLTNQLQDQEWYDFTSDNRNQRYTQQYINSTKCNSNDQESTQYRRQSIQSSISSKTDQVVLSRKEPSQTPSEVHTISSGSRSGSYNKEKSKTHTEFPKNYPKADANFSTPTQIHKQKEMNKLKQNVNFLMKLCFQLMEQKQQIEKSFEERVERKAKQLQEQRIKKQLENQNQQKLDEKKVKQSPKEVKYEEKKDPIKLQKEEKQVLNNKDVQRREIQQKIKQRISNKSVVSTTQSKNQKYKKKLQKLKKEREIQLPQTFIIKNDVHSQTVTPTIQNDSSFQLLNDSLRCQSHIFYSIVTESDAEKSVRESYQINDVTSEEEHENGNENVIVNNNVDVNGNVQVKNQQNSQVDYRQIVSNPQKGNEDNKEAFKKKSSIENKNAINNQLIQQRNIPPQNPTNNTSKNMNSNPKPLRIIKDILTMGYKIMCSTKQAQLQQDKVKGKQEKKKREIQGVTSQIFSSTIQINNTNMKSTAFLRQ